VRYRLKHAAAAAVLLGVSLSVDAAGLGRLTVLSALGQPFRGEVDLVSLKKDEAASLSVKIAGIEAFRQADLPYTAYIGTLRVSIERRPGGEPYVQVAATQALNEPFVDFLIELSWSSGRLVRAYTALVDPPAVTDQKTAETALPVAPAEAAPAALAAPARPAVEAEPLQPRLSEPTGTAEAARQSAAAPAAAARAPGGQMAPSSGAEYGPVKRGDTLGRIARATRPADVTLDQMLVALYRANPGAFDGANMNRLRTGKVLRVPPAEEVAALSAVESASEVRVQTSNWNAYRARLASAVEASATPAEREGGRSASGKVTTRLEDKVLSGGDAAQDVLKLSKGEPPRPGGAAQPASGDAVRAAERVRSLEEEVAARGKAAADANQRVAQLEKQIQDLQALVEMKSRAMADLQKPAVVAPAAAAKPAAEVPPVAAPDPAALPVPGPTTTPAAGTGLGEEALPGPKPLESGSSAGTPEGSPAGAETPVAEPPAPAAPQRPRVVAPPSPPPAPPGLLDELLDNPVFLGVGALVAAALAGLGFAGWKRRRGARGDVKAVEAPEAAEVSEVRAPETFGPAGFEPVSVAPPGADALPGTATVAEESDPLAEAEVFLIYGRDAQAEERLQEAIAANPKRVELHAKLLEIYAKRRDVTAFERVAVDLQRLTGGSGEAWVQAAALGAELDPGNPRYAPPGDGTATDATMPGFQPTATDATLPGHAPSAAAAPMAASADAAKQVPAVGEDLDFNLDFDTLTEGATTDIDLSKLGPADEGGGTETDIDLDQFAGPTAAEDIFDPTRTIIDVGLDTRSGSVTTAGFDAARTVAPASFDPGATLSPVGFDAASTLSPARTDQTATLPGGAGAPSKMDSMEIDFELPDVEPTMSGGGRVGDETIDDLGFDLDRIRIDLGAPSGSPLTEPRLPGGLSLAQRDEDEPGATLPGLAQAPGLAGLSLDLGSPEETITGTVRDERWYDVQTKFDLAKAYQEMGDKEGAREILDEVVAEGDDSQKKAARDLLATLS
jgi:pilus assembly protein FimV